MSNKLTPIEMLDKALHWFAMDAKEMGIGEQLTSRQFIEKAKALKLMVDKFPELNSHEFSEYSNLIIRKLCKDGYIEESHYGENFYSITFDGKVFHQLGGYKNRNDIISNAEKIKNNREKYLLYGTWAVAIGAIALVAWEMIKTFLIDKH